jgi:MraZ protein
MPVFIGEYTYSLDEKGRVSIPAKLRDALGIDFILTRGLDGCVAAYSLEAWESLSAKIAALPTAKARDLKRFMFASATQVTPDKQGRVLISSRSAAMRNSKRRSPSSARTITSRSGIVTNGKAAATR